MTRQHSGPLHQINYQLAVANGIPKVQATCTCGNLNSPGRFGRERAEEDARQHLLEAAPTQGITRANRGGT